MGHGIVGGSMSPVYRQGIVAGQTLLGLFGMKNFAAEPGAIRVPALRQVDERQMARWHLSEKNLPEGYEVVNRAPSLLRDYRKHVAVALLFFFAQSALIFRLLVLGRIRRSDGAGTPGNMRGTGGKAGRAEPGRWKPARKRGDASIHTVVHPGRVS